MKRFVALALLAASLGVGLAACGDYGSGSSNGANSSSSSKAGY